MLCVCLCVLTFFSPLATHLGSTIIRNERGGGEEGGSASRIAGQPEQGHVSL